MDKLERDRDKLRYPSDLTDAEWQLIKPLIPPAKRGGGKRTGKMRDVCAEHRLPAALHSEGPATARHGERLLLPWGWNGTLQKIHHPLYMNRREQAGREASPTACVIDSQSVKGAEKGAPSSTLTALMPAADQGEEVSPPVDTLGLVLHVLVTAANFQDRDGGALLLSTLFGQFPFLRKVFADSAYTGPVFHEGATTAIRSLVVEIVRRADPAKGFVVEPKRWIPA